MVSFSISVICISPKPRLFRLNTSYFSSHLLRRLSPCLSVCWQTAVFLTGSSLVPIPIRLLCEDLKPVSNGFVSETRRNWDWETTIRTSDVFTGLGLGHGIYLHCIMGKLGPSLFSPLRDHRNATDLCLFKWFVFRRFFREMIRT